MRHSIILLSYNRPRMIQEAIRSVLSQSYSNLELIIADDNSDELVHKVIGLYLPDSRIKVFRSAVKDKDRMKKQRGQEVINAVLKSGMVTGDTVSYLADDDFYLPNRLRIFDRRFEDHPEIDCYYSDQLIINEETGGGSLRGTVGVTKQIACKIDMGSVMHRTRIFEKVGFWEDYDKEDYKPFDRQTFKVVDSLFFDKVAKAGYYFYPINIPLDVHRYHGKAYTRAIEQGLETTGWRE